MSWRTLRGAQALCPCCNQGRPRRREHQAIRRVQPLCTVPAVRMQLHVMVNAAGLRSGGGRTYLIALAEELSRGGTRDLRWTLLAPADIPLEPRVYSRERLEIRPQPTVSPIRRTLWDQVVLPRVAADERADVLVSAGNFAPLRVGCPRVLIAHDARYFSSLRIRGRAGLRMSLETALARASVRRANATVVPTRSMASRVAKHTGRAAVPIPFGPGLVARQERSPRQRFTFVHRTCWGPHKRLADLLLAVRELARTDADAFELHSACDPTSPFARRFRESRAERQLLLDPIIARHVLFRTFDQAREHAFIGHAAVIPSTTESFCFPLAEAAALGVPAVAVDLPYAREVCRDAALYVEPTSPSSLADGMRRVLHGEHPRNSGGNALSWKVHVDRLAALCASVAV